MNRRSFVTGLGAVLARPHPAWAQPPPGGEVEEDVAKDDSAVLGAFPGAKCWRIVTPVDPREDTALGRSRRVRRTSLGSARSLGP